MSFYTPTGNPANITRGSSALVRSEFNLIEQAFNKLPPLVSGNANYIPKIKSDFTGMENSGLADNGTTITADKPIYISGYCYGTTPPAGDGSNKFATTQFVNSVAFAATLPAQTGNRGKFVTTDGTVASWGSQIAVNATSKTTGYTAAAGDTYSQDTTAGGFTVTLPASPAVGDAPILIHDIAGTWATNALVLDPGANKIKGTTGTCNCRITNFCAWLVWSGATYGWVFL